MIDKLVDVTRHAKLYHAPCIRDFLYFLSLVAYVNLKNKHNDDDDDDDVALPVTSF